MPAMPEGVDRLPLPAPGAGIDSLEWSMRAMLAAPGATPDAGLTGDAGAPIPGIFEWSIPDIGGEVSPLIPGMFE
jgi:hypothetical protein